MDALTMIRDDGPVVTGLRRLVRRPFAWSGPAVVVIGGVLTLAVVIVESLPALAVAVTIGVVLLGVLLGGAGTPRTDWLTPAALRAVELVTVIKVSFLYPESTQVQAGLYLVVVVLHTYDTVYRLRLTGRPPARWVQRAGGGWDTRVLVVCALALTPALPFALVIAAGFLAVLFATEMVIFFSAGPARRAPERAVNN